MGTGRPRQWLWFVGLWAAGVGVTALVGYAIKLWLKCMTVIPSAARDLIAACACMRSLAALGMTVRSSAAAAGS